MQAIVILLLALSSSVTAFSRLTLLEVSVTRLSSERIQQFSLRQEIWKLHQSKQVLECALVAAKHLLSDQFLVFIAGDSAEHEPQCFITTQEGSLHRKLQAASPVQPPCCTRIFAQSFSKFWVTIQHRIDGSVDFYRNWSDYANGFGQGPDANYWIGLYTLHSLTSPTPKQLRVRMKLWNNTEYWADYASFSVANEANKFRLNVSGYSAALGNPKDSLADHNEMRFSTYDSDNDMKPTNCATEYPGGWWYKSCHATNPNGLYFTEEQVMNTPDNPSGITWSSMFVSHYPLKEIEMLLKV